MAGSAGLAFPHLQRHPLGVDFRFDGSDQSGRVGDHHHLGLSRGAGHQSAQRGELRANAHTAISRKGVVGSSGSTVPTPPKPTQVQPMTR